MKKSAREERKPQERRLSLKVKMARNSTPHKADTPKGSGCPVKVPFSFSDTNRTNGLAQTGVFTPTHKQQQ